MMMRAFLSVLLAAVALASGCDGPAATPPVSPVATLVATRSGSGFDLTIKDLVRPVRALQVDVKIDGARATSAAAIGNSDVLAAGLSSPKSDFTIVASDTRRLNLSGAVVHVETDGAFDALTLNRALAVDDTGAKRELLLVSP